MTWDYHPDQYEKQAEADPIWRLERQILYAHPSTRLNRQELEKYLPQLKIPEDTRAFLELLLWNKKF